MALIVRRSRVEDYARWKTVYQAGEAARRAAGWRDQQIFRNPDDPNEIVFVTEVDDLEQARAYAKSEEVQRRQRASGLLETTYFYPEREG
jgi:hypothetical protein